MYCENCGTSLNAGSKFCSACGKKIEADESSPRASDSTGGRRRTSSYTVQTILLTSIPSLLLAILVPWLIIPSAFQSTTMRGRQPDEQSASKFAATSPHVEPPSLPLAEGSMPKMRVVFLGYIN